MMRMVITFPSNVLPDERNGLISDLAEMGADVNQAGNNSYEVTVNRSSRIESVVSQLESEQRRGRVIITERQDD